ncbi:hypothetical protein [Leifsonia shinshuensis]|uniref:Lysophospholipase n=1 Tax=Leifsonia shinshuensis TaxID=150026 RepID=A0A7G6YDA8_9MICO|nr:hypothetical protein [Leifsonia shinshuensis]QNE36473.1 lysophospholipase [Leifsonia shinshuensis]
MTVGKGDHKQQYQVIDTQNHPANGFQAMAVAPLVDGIPDLSHIVISYAGTNPNHRADVVEDIVTIVGGTQGPLSQVADAKQFADHVRQAHPGSSISTAGHSLGGFLALLVAAENGWDGASFNGPDPWEWLSPEAKKQVEADIRAGRDRLTNYVIEWDLIGNLYAHRTGATVFATDKPGRSELDYHNIGEKSAFRFARDGSVEDAGAKGRRLEDILGNLMDSFLPGASEAVSPLLQGLAGITRNPAAMNSLAKNASGALVAVASIAALGLAASIGGTATALIEIKSANGRIIPRMEDALLAAKNAAAFLPTITAYDIERCVDRHRLHVHQNVDLDAVRTVDERVDRHLVRVGQLSQGISQTVRNTLHQDAQWALTFGLGG